MFRSIASALLLLLGALALPGTARADIFKLGEFGFVAGDEPGTYELTASLPEPDATTTGMIWPNGCTQVDADRQASPGEVRLSFEIRCDRALVKADVIRTPWALDGATFLSDVMGVRVSRSLAADDAGLILPIGETAAPERAIGEVTADFVWQGILHILTGWDHLAFVLCLCLLTRGRTLLWLVTAFTLGHSLSLALAFFEVVRIPVPPVEAVIALSIAFMAREALRARGVIEGAPDRQRYIAVVAGFGLLHGLGFASVLDELGVAPSERVSGLLFFNIGVEIGQLLFVGAVLAAMTAARRVERLEPLRTAALYATGAVGCFWLIERLAGFPAA